MYILFVVVSVLSVLHSGKFPFLEGRKGAIVFVIDDRELPWRGGLGASGVASRVTRGMGFLLGPQESWSVEHWGKFQILGEASEGRLVVFGVERGEVESLGSVGE